MSKPKKTKAKVKAVPGQPNQFKVELPLAQRITGAFKDPTPRPDPAAKNSVHDIQETADSAVVAMQAVTGIADEMAKPVTPEEHHGLKPPAFLDRSGDKRLTHEEAAKLAAGHVDWAPIISIEESRERAKQEDARRQQAAMVFSVANPLAPVEVSIKEGSGPVTGCAQYPNWEEFKAKHDWTKYPLSRVIGEKDLTVVLLKVTPWVYSAAPEAARPVKKGAQTGGSDTGGAGQKAPKAPKVSVSPSGYIPNSRLAMAIRNAGFELRGGVPMLFERPDDGSSLVVKPPEKEGGKSSSNWTLSLKGKAPIEGSGYTKLETTLKKEDA